MNHLDSLTLQKKIMNMAKLGTVSRSLKIYSLLGNPLESRAGGLMRYTLCVFQGAERRNSFRNNSCSFPDVAAIRSGRLGALRREASPLLIICSIIVPLKVCVFSRCGGAS
jgi:hypothetical protein